MLTTRLFLIWSVHWGLLNFCVTVQMILLHLRVKILKMLQGRLPNIGPSVKIIAEKLREPRGYIRIFTWHLLFFSVVKIESNMDHSKTICALFTDYLCTIHGLFVDMEFALIFNETKVYQLFLVECVFLLQIKLKTAKCYFLLVFSSKETKLTAKKYLFCDSVNL